MLKLGGRDSAWALKGIMIQVQVCNLQSFVSRSLQFFLCEFNVMLSNIPLPIPKGSRKGNWWSILMSDPFCTGLFYPGAVSYKQCTMYAGKTLQNYHTCALLDPKKKGQFNDPCHPWVADRSQNTALWRWRSTKARSSSPINQSGGSHWSMP